MTGFSAVTRIGLRDNAASTTSLRTRRPLIAPSASARMAPHVARTPLVADPRLPQVWLKCEHRQPTGAFKLRGATNAVLSLAPDALSRGVVTASTGNHGRALAHAARLAGTRAVVCLSRLVPQNKVAAIRDLGAEVRIVGASQDEAMVEVARAVCDEGLTEIAPFDDAAVVAGQGTIGLEIAEDAPDATTILVPLSGGGLIAGIAVAVKALRPGTRIVGVTMESGAAMIASLAAGAPVEVEDDSTLAEVWERFEKPAPKRPAPKKAAPKPPEK